MLTERQLPVPSPYYRKYASIYTDTETIPKACILYFHGGGLLYGTRRDLPALHKKTLTEAGYCIIAFDYPLAPAAGLELILEDVRASVEHYLEHPEAYAKEALPYFLWGRSAGAYLCLMAGADTTCSRPPSGILSYYGYGFLCDGWFQTPSSHYCSLPPVSSSVLYSIPSDIHADGDLHTHYGSYVYARQTGTWLSLLYTGREKYFYLDYTLRTCEKMSCPLFCAHSTNDTDVPYSEFLELCSRYQAMRFVTASPMHDFDRDEKEPAAARLLHASLKFLESCLR